LHVAEEFNLHDVNLLDPDTGHLRPGLVSVGVVVQKLVAEHQGHGEQSVLTSGLSSHFGIVFLQTVDEQQSKKYHVVSNTSGR
jgi:hypothetical protein